MTSASTSTEPIICRRLPPMARISANSRVRCATMIENVLRIRKTPTNSATPAKPRKMLLMNVQVVLRAARSRPLAVAFRSWPGSRAHVADSRSRTASGVTPASVSTSMSSRGWPAEHQFLRHGFGERHSCAPPIESRPPL